MRVKVKICGITHEEDAEAAVTAGADALGFNFCPRSVRCLSASAAARIVRRIPPFVTTVAVFVDPDTDTVQAVLRAAAFDLLQFHGRETAEFCESFGRPYIKTVRVRDEAPEGLDVEHPNARAWLLDTFVPGADGGTARAFDWSCWPRGVARPLILAGGLTPQNVAAAIVATRPYGVDVASGVESTQAGRKDVPKLNRFVAEARDAADRL